MTSKKRTVKVPVRIPDPELPSNDKPKHRHVGNALMVFFVLLFGVTAAQQWLYNDAEQQVSNVERKVQELTAPEKFPVYAEPERADVSPHQLPEAAPTPDPVPEPAPEPEAAPAPVEPAQEVQTIPPEPFPVLEQPTITPEVQAAPAPAEPVEVHPVPEQPAAPEAPAVRVTQIPVYCCDVLEPRVEKVVAKVKPKQKRKKARRVAPVETTNDIIMRALSRDLP